MDFPFSTFHTDVSAGDDAQNSNTSAMLNNSFFNRFFISCLKEDFVLFQAQADNLRPPLLPLFCKSQFPGKAEHLVVLAQYLCFKLS